MTCKLEPEFKPTKKSNLVFIEQQQQFNIRNNQIGVLRQNSRYAMSTAETCNIIDNTIDSLKRSMALIAERVSLFFVGGRGQGWLTTSIQEKKNQLFIQWC